MKLAHEILPDPILFEEGKIQVLVVENGECLFQMITELKAQIEGIDGRFILSQDNLPMDIQKTANLIIDPFSMQINSRKILSQLGKILENEALQNSMYVETNAIIRSLQSYANRLSMTTTLPINWNEEVQVSTLIKMLGYEFCLDSPDLAENLMDYIQLHRELLEHKCFIVLNLKSYMSTENLERLYYDLIYRKLNILLIESRDSKRIGCEKVRVIDGDLCVF